MRRFWSLVGLVVLLFLTQSPQLRADAAGVTRGFHAGWNLVALPPGTALAGVQGLYTLQPGDSRYETIAPEQGSTGGFGYWAHLGGNTVVSLAQGDGAAYSVDAPAGQFILIGDPSGSTPATVSGADVVYTYDAASGYHATTTLLQGQGAWAMAADGGTITVTPAAFAAPATPAQPAAALSLAAPASPVARPPEVSGLGDALTPDTVSITPDTSDSRFVLVTGSWGYQVELPAGWIQMPPPLASDNPLASLVNNLLETFKSPDGAVVLGITKLPTHPPGYDALRLRSDVVDLAKSQSDQGIGAFTDFQILDPPHLIALPGADSAATAETSSKLIIIGRTAIERTITALKGEASYDFILTWQPDLPADTLLPTGFALLP